MSYTRATTKKRRKIQAAFAELLSERGSINNITVTDLAERAEITRGTFYNYYNNIHEVGAELQGEIESKLFSKYASLSSFELVEKYIDEVFVFFIQQESIYRELIASEASITFLSQLENEMSERVLEAMRANGVNSKDAKIELLFLINGTIAIIRKYYRSEISLSLDEIREYLKDKLRELFEKYGR